MTSDPTAERPLAPDSAPANRLVALPLFAPLQSSEQPPPRLAAVPSPVTPQHQSPPRDVASRPDAAAESATAGLGHSPSATLGGLARPLEATAAAAGAAPTSLACELPDGAASLACERLTAVAGLAHQPLGGPAGRAPLPTPTAVPGIPDDAGTRREPPPQVHAGSAVDWAQVRAFRQQAAELLTGQLRDRPGLDEASRREIGRALIVAMLRDHADNLLAEGGSPPSAAQEHTLAGAIFDALFGLGRLQPLVDDPAVENVEITGCDQVHLVYGDGRVQPGPPVADSDEELIETLAFLAARSGGRSGSGERAFSPASPILDLTLHGGARLAARAWITPRPTVVIRRHRLTDVDLDDLRRLGMLDDALVAFLSAAVRAGKSIVVSGAQGAGKTTLVRALCNEMDPWERIGTIETEYELHLHELPDRHHRVVAHEARPGTGERTTDGRAAGEITLDDLLYSSLRLNLSRVIVGEVRGREVIPMFKAMQAGAGSLSTTHAHDARAAIERLVTCALEAGPHVTQEYAYLQIASHIDLIVQIGVDDRTSAGGRKHRYVREVIEVARGEGGRPAITDVFGPDPDGRAVPRTRPSFLSDLERAGFDPDWLDSPTGSWHTTNRDTDRQTGDQPAEQGRR